MKILLVEDDETIVQLLQPTLASQRYLVELATDGQAGWELVDSFEYDLILLDVMLPKLDGINFCKKLRAKGDRTPVLLLTAQDSSTDKVRGLDAGADDYALKPFDIEELLARIRALLRRSSATPSPVLEWGFLRLDPSSCEVTYDGKLLHLTAKEYGILELLLRNTHRIFSQSALLDRVWSFDEPPTENTVRAHIKSLRQKIKKAGAPDPIETVYGLGYRLKAEERESGVVEAGLSKDSRLTS
ncbi:response regulator transcription factor, partial [Chroococcidiopsis sp. CCALA 051]|uniref:response regulator transcription factor n=1 Tax=Chroococcidiopsis sp. CCALA 051 TaxID=869949 RepID=UPI0018EA4CDA